MLGPDAYGRHSSCLCCEVLVAALGLPATRATAGPLSVGDMMSALRRAGARPELAVCQSLEDLAMYDDATALVALVDAGVLWSWRAAQSPGSANHAVLVRAVLRDAADEAVNGVLVEDPTRPGSVVRLNAETLFDAWLRPGGLLIATRGGASTYAAG